MDHDALPLSLPTYHVLVALARGPGHGYGLIQAIRERTGGEVDLTPSTLYGVLHRMLEKGWLSEAEGTEAEAGGGPRRRIYRLTEEGRAVARAEARRLARAAGYAVEVELLDASGLEPGRP
jgi:DNA-binding PadR family transcriptional regulator